MVKGWSVSVASDTREFQRGIQSGVLKPLEGVETALDDVARSGEKAGDKLERSLDDARDGVKDTQRDYKQLGDIIDRETRRGGSAMSRNTAEATSNAKRDLNELGNEARQNAAETFSSFDGSAESFADGVQGTLGGIVSSLGPIGAAVGAAGALGIGFIISALEDADEASQKHKERVTELAQEWIDAGEAGSTSIEFIIDKLKEMSTTNEDGEQTLADLLKTATTAETTFKDIAQAYAGNTRGLDELIRKQEQHRDALREDATAAFENGWQNTKANQRKIEAQDKVLEGLRQARTVAEDAGLAQQAAAAAGIPELERKQHALDELQSDVDDAAGSWEQYKDKESGALDPAAYLAGIQTRIGAANNYAANLAAAQAQLSPEAYQYLVDQGIDFAPMLQSILDSGLVGQMGATFTEAATAGAAAIEKNMPAEVPGPVVKTTADTDPATTAITAVEDAPRQTMIMAQADTSTAARQLDAVARAAYNATVRAGADTSDAEFKLDRLVRRRQVDIAVNLIDRYGVPVL